MNLHRMLQEREANNNPLRVGLIGAGKFGAMFLSQIARTPGMQMVGIADLNPANARKSLKRIGWPANQYSAKTFSSAVKHGTTAIVADSQKLIATAEVDIIIDATGSPAAGIAHVLQCCEHGKDIVMVNVEADALAGPLLAQKAKEAGIVYSMAYGDQPAMICEMVDWARATGFEVISAGKGTKYLPVYHQSTPDDVWDYYGLSAADAKKGGMNPQMFNSFLDGTKSALEMAAVANATGLSAPKNGLAFTACGVDDITNILRPKDEGGILSDRGQVEVVSSLERDQRPVYRDLRWGVYVTFAADTDYVRRCFKEYGLKTDDSGNYAAMYKPYHLIGLELGISVASVGLRREPVGQTAYWQADVVATAKRDLKKGEVLDGEGGYRVYGKLMPARQSLKLGGLPLGLAHGVKLKRSVKAGAAVSWNDVSFDKNNQAMQFRRDMEQQLKRVAGR
ncbi:MAG: Gfo/Idh/MocA family oxidoreductase [Granulosicoccus sp.]|nr:Gfo/Idh/MocA family oxidoreductase [Granulosicoccus sp.]